MFFSPSKSPFSDDNFPPLRFNLKYCSEVEEEDIELLERKVDQICQEFKNKVNEKLCMKDVEISDLVDAKTKLEQDIQLYLLRETEHQQNFEQTMENLEKEIESLMSANQKLKTDSEESLKRKDNEIQNISIALENVINLVSFH